MDVGYSVFLISVGHQNSTKFFSIVVCRLVSCWRIQLASTSESANNSFFWPSLYLKTAGISLSAQAQLEVNTLGRAVDQWISLASGQALNIHFADERAVQAVQIQQGRLSVDGLGVLEGRLSLSANLTKIAGQSVTELLVGMEGMTAPVSYTHLTLPTTSRV